MGWNSHTVWWYRCLHCWSLGMDRQFHPTLCWACDFISMLRLKLIHVSKRGLADLKSSHFGSHALYSSRFMLFIYVHTEMGKLESVEIDLKFMNTFISNRLRRIKTCSKFTPKPSDMPSRLCVLACVCACVLQGDGVRSAVRPNKDLFCQQILAKPESRLGPMWMQ